MDEQILFDRFHEALEMEPRPGAYERMRFAMTNRPVAVKRRPAFRMRWSRMGLRLAAGLTAAVIVIAVAAAFIAAHRGPVGSAPAAPDPNVKAYQAMISSDYNASANPTFICSGVQDANCQTSVRVAIPLLQKWIVDLNSFQTPSRFVAMDGQLRAHLNQAIADLNAIGAFQTAGNQNGFNLAFEAGTYERAWIDPTTFALEGAYPKVAGTYHDAFRLTRQSLDACVNGTPAPADLGCAGLRAAVCTAGSTQTCVSDLQTADTQLQMFLIALLQNPAPSALTIKTTQLQADLAKADTAVLAITDAVLRGDAANVAAGELSYSDAISSADGDTVVIGNP